jgi:hypothetical protein
MTGSGRVDVDSVRLRSEGGQCGIDLHQGVEAGSDFHVVAYGSRRKPEGRTVRNPTPWIGSDRDMFAALRSLIDTRQREIDEWRVQVMPPAGGYPAYTLVTLKSRDKYVSEKKHKSHAEAATWVQQLQTHYHFQANDISGKPQTWTDQPRGATIY